MRTGCFRALRWRRGDVDAEAIARACGQAKEPGGSSYGMRLDRLGVPTIVWGVLASRGAETLLLELEAPELKLPFVEDAYAAWWQRAAE